MLVIAEKSRGTRYQDPTVQSPSLPALQSGPPGLWLSGFYSDIRLGTALRLRQAHERLLGSDARLEVCFVRWSHMDPQSLGSKLNTIRPVDLVNGEWGSDLSLPFLMRLLCIEP